MSPPAPGEPIVEMAGVCISYSRTTVLGDWHQDSSATPGLHWTIRRGQRWGIFGPNGSGKTTLLSLVTSDHPQTYAAPVKLFGRSRVPNQGETGISIFELQRRIGHASPEVHALFPGYIGVRKAVESAWGETPLTKPVLDDEARRRVDAALRWFAPELVDSPIGGNASQDAGAVGEELVQKLSETRFSALSLSQQRIALFLRAVVASPDIVILDEAFSGMDDAVRDKCLMFLSHGTRVASRTSRGVAEEVELWDQITRSKEAERGREHVPGLRPHQALLVVSHAREEVPGCVREWMCLPEAGTRRPPRVGRWDGPVEMDPRRWDSVWGI